MTDLASRFTTLRQNLRISVEDLAAFLCVTPRYVQMIESGKTLAQPSSLLKLFSLLEGGVITLAATKPAPDATMTFVACAMRGAEMLPPAERADLYDVAATILGQVDPTAAASAARAASAIRESEAAQMHFANIIA